MLPSAPEATRSMSRRELATYSGTGSGGCKAVLLTLPKSPRPRALGQLGSRRDCSCAAEFGNPCARALSSLADELVGDRVPGRLGAGAIFVLLACPLGALVGLTEFVGVPGAMPEDTNGDSPPPPESGCVLLVNASDAERPPNREPANAALDSTNGIASAPAPSVPCWDWPEAALGGSRAAITLKSLSSGAALGALSGRWANAACPVSTSAQLVPGRDSADGPATDTSMKWTACTGVVLTKICPATAAPTTAPATHGGMSCGASRPSSATTV